MKKMILFAFLAMAMFSLGMTSTEAAPAKKKAAARADQFEPNNTKETASDISNLIGNQHTEYEKWYGINLSASIGSKTDYDWYKFKLNKNKAYYIKAIADGDKGINYISTYDDNKLLEKETISFGNASSETYSKVYGSDYFYMQVLPYVPHETEDGWDSIFVKNNYDLVAYVDEYDPVEPDKYESNDSLEAAYIIPYSNKIDINATIDKFDDVDYYTVYFQPGKKYRITISCDIDSKFADMEHVVYGRYEDCYSFNASVLDFEEDLTYDNFDFQGGDTFFMQVEPKWPYGSHGIFPYHIYINIEEY